MARGIQSKEIYTIQEEINSPIIHIFFLKWNRCIGFAIIENKNAMVYKSLYISYHSLHLLHRRRPLHQIDWLFHRLHHDQHFHCLDMKRTN